MKFVKGLSILGLAMASQGAWAAGGSQASDVYFSATATCAASIDVVGGDVGASGSGAQGSSTNPIILNAAIRDDRKLAVNGYAQVKVKSKCGYTIELANMTLEEGEATTDNRFIVEPSLADRGPATSDGDSLAIQDEAGFTPVVTSAPIATPESESVGNEHSIYIREIATHSAVRGFSARPLTGKVVVTVVEL